MAGYTQAVASPDATTRSETDQPQAVSSAGPAVRTHPDQPQRPVTLSETVRERSPTGPADRASPSAANLYVFAGFQSVEITVKDTNGKVVDDAIFAYALEGVPTGGPVQGGTGEILLNTSFSYEEFVVVGQSTVEDGPRYAWYAEGELQEEISAFEEEATIVVEPEEIKGGDQGTFAGMGAFMG